MKARKYERGRRIKTVDELLRQPFAIHKPNRNQNFEKIYHRGWFISWPLRLAHHLVEVGELYTAKPKGGAK